MFAALALVLLPVVAASITPTSLGAPVLLQPPPPPVDALLACTGPAAALQPACPTWEHRVDGIGQRSDRAFDMVRDGPGQRLFVTGPSWGEHTGFDNETGWNMDNGLDYLTLAVDATDGAELWRARYNGSRNLSDVANAIAYDAGADRVFVSGRSYGNGTRGDIVTLAYDADDGTLLWEHRLATPYNESDVGFDIAHAPGNDLVLVAGRLGVDEHRARAVVVAIEAATGSSAWTYVHQGVPGSSHAAFALDIAPDGATVYASGQGDRADQDWDYLTLALDTASGTLAWEARYDHGTLDIATAQTLSSDGRTLFVTGYSHAPRPALGTGGTGRDAATVAYDPATGETLWAARLEGPSDRDGTPGWDGAWAAATSPDGALVHIVGESQGPTLGPVGTGLDAFVATYDAEAGSLVWLQRTDGPGHGDDRARTVAVDAAGRVLVAGDTTTANGHAHPFVQAFDGATGAPLWSLLQPGRPGDAGGALVALVPGADGHVHAAGWLSSQSTDHDTLVWTLHQR